MFRRMQYSLRALLGLVTLLCIGFGWLRHEWRLACDQERVLQGIRGNNATIVYSFDDVISGPAAVRPSWAPAWIADRLGPDVFGTVRQVQFHHPVVLTDELTSAICNLPTLRGLTITNSSVPVPQLRRIVQLPNLDALNFVHCDLTDEHVGELRRASQLRVLGLWNSSVTDACIDDLVHLPLREVVVTDTKISRAGVKRMKREMPECAIASFFWDGQRELTTDDP